MKTNGNDFVDGHFTHNGQMHTNPNGLTKRELFAAMAMQGLSTVVRLKTTDIARYAVETADALIAELNKEQGV